MSSHLVLTVLGPDRPGLVEALSRTIAEHGANWLESRMARLAGKFAGILRVSVAPSASRALTEALLRLEAEGLAIVVEESGAEPPALGAEGFRLELVGQDRPGIVHDVSGVLAECGVNVEELVTECVSAPMSGETLFKASATLRLPEGLDVARLRQALEQLENDLMVEIDLQESRGA